MSDVREESSLGMSSTRRKRKEGPEEQDVYKRQPLHICNKGRFMNALEELEIYNAYNNNDSSLDCVLNEQLNFVSNRLYDTALRLLNGFQSVADNT